MKLKTLVLVNLFALTSVSIAAPIDHCPSIAALQSSHIQNLILEADHTWDAFFYASQYDTNTNWTFALSGGDAHKVDNQKAAQQAAINALKTLQFVQGPLQVLNGDTACIYSSATAERAVAINPPIKFQR